MQGPLKGQSWDFIKCLQHVEGTLVSAYLMDVYVGQKLALVRTQEVVGSSYLFFSIADYDFLPKNVSKSVQEQIGLAQFPIATSSFQRFHGSSKHL